MAATAIGSAALAAPVGLSLAAVWTVERSLGPPRGPFALHLAWWAGLAGLGTVALIAGGRLSRRLLPLSALMRLSLVFPDGAPSRFRVALRRGTVATLEERLAATRAGALERTPAEAAGLLLELVRHLDEHDPLTRGHSERVRAYAQSIGPELGLGRHELDLLNWAALLHDVGKLEVPHETLAKSGRPTDEEWEALRRHPSAGASLAAPLEPWLGEWSAAIAEHHERWDGTGYPRGLAGDEISLAGRIVAVADVFDVITSSRSYKQPGSIAEARRELSRCAGTQFDPQVVRAFLAISVRQRRLAAPVAWLAHAAALVRLPATQVAATASAGAAAVVAVSVATGAGATTAPAVARPPMAVPAAVTTTGATARPVPARAVSPNTARVRADPKSHEASRASSPPAGRRRPPAQPAAPTASVRPVVTTDRGHSAPVAAPVANPASTPPPVPVSAKASSAPSAAGPAGAPAPTLPRAAAPTLRESVTSTAEGLSDGVASTTDDVTALTGDVVSLADPGTPVSDDVPAIVDDVSSLAGDASSLLAPPELPAPSGQPPPADPDETSDEPDGHDTSLVERTVSSLSGLLSSPAP